MENNDKQQLIGLVGAVQSLALVNQVATTGEFDREAAETVLGALLVYNPDSAYAAYGSDSANLHLGATALKKILNAQQVSDVASYLLNVLSVENKLVRKDQLLTKLREGCQEIANSVHSYEPEQTSDSHRDEKSEDGDFEAELDDEISDSNTEGSVTDSQSEAATNLLLNEAIADQIAALYKQTASTIDPRIMINGDAKYLRDPILANWIRAFLLAAMRGAGFFRHYGGSRINMLMKRATYLDELKRL